MECTFSCYCFFIQKGRRKSMKAQFVWKSSILISLGRQSFNYHPCFIVSRGHETIWLWTTFETKGTVCESQWQQTTKQWCSLKRFGVQLDLDHANQGAYWAIVLQCTHLVTLYNGVIKYQYTTWTSKFISFFWLYKVNLCIKIFKRKIKSMVQTVEC